MTVEELLARIDSAELTEWAAYERIEGPLGPARGDIQAAVVAKTLADVNRGKNQQPHNLTDFIPTWDQDRPAQHQDADEQLAMVRQWMSSVGGRIRQREE